LEVLRRWADAMAEGPIAQERLLSAVTGAPRDGTLITSTVLKTLDSEKITKRMRGGVGHVPQTGGAGEVEKGGLIAINPAIQKRTDG